MAGKGIEKVTWMKLKTAPLDSEKNFSKVKTALCKFSQIRDQTFDEKNNTVIIKVVCCSPEKIMDKLCSKGHGAIKFIETIDPPKSEAPKPKAPEKPKEGEKPKEPEKPKPAQAGPSAQPMMMGQPMTYPVGYYQPPMPYSQPAPNQQYGYPSRPVYDNYGNRIGAPPPPNHPYHGNSAFDANYFSDDNTQGCTIM